MSKARYACSVCQSDFHEFCTNLACVVGYHNAKSRKADGVEPENDPLEHEYQKNYELGMVSVLEDLSQKFAERAGAAFAEGDDKRAFFYRELKEEYAKRGAAARVEWTKRFKK